MNVNLIAPISDLGCGVDGLNIFKALTQLGHRVAFWPLGAVTAPEQDVEAILQAVKRTDLFDASAPSLRIHGVRNMAWQVGRGRRIGLTTFELDKLGPVARNQLASLDTIVVPSRWAAEVLVQNGLDAAAIRVAPFGVDPTVFPPVGSRPHRDGAPTVFLNCGKWEVRKGHDFLLDAFSAAFGPRDNVRLVMNCHNPHSDVIPPGHNQDYARKYKASPLGKKIAVVSRRLPTQHDVAGLMAGADCGFFPARGEGWNHGLAQMMAMGKSVIATHYSAHTEYCTPESCRPITVTRKARADDDVFFRGAVGKWAYLGKAQLEQAVEHLRAVHREKQQGGLRTNQAGIDTFKRLTWQGTVQSILAA
jgi:glycosyltransferase involved in cell wall biosynthesis